VLLDTANENRRGNDCEVYESEIRCLLKTFTDKNQSEERGCIRKYDGSLDAANDGC
jgi:hypothetical protein